MLELKIILEVMFAILAADTIKWIINKIYMLDDQDFSKLPEYKKLYCIPCGKETEHHLIYRIENNTTYLKSKKCLSCLQLTIIHWHDYIVKKTGISL